MAAQPPARVRADVTMKEPLSPPAHLTEFEFRSRLPVVGGVISAFRRAWHGIAGAWAMRWLAQQQDRINLGVAEALIQQTERLNQQAEALKQQTEALTRQEEALASQVRTAREQAAALQRAQAVAGELAGRISVLASRHAELSGVLAEFGGRNSALAEALKDLHGQIAAGDFANRQAELAQETRAQTSALAARMEHLESVSQAYLEELGRELAELALKVGAMRTPNDPAHPDGA